MFNEPLTDPGARARAWRDSLLVDHGIFRTIWDNWAEVVPGKLYRSNHPTPGRLKRAVERHGITTLINLRGHRKCGSDALSREAAKNLGLKHIDMAFESRGAPHKDRILRFHEIYQNLDGPTLMHCKSGADRAGLAAGLAILFEGGTAQDALNQLSIRYGHFKRSRTGILDAFFIKYYQESTSGLSFRSWLANEYDELELRSAFKNLGLVTFVVDHILKRE